MNKINTFLQSQKRLNFISGFFSHFILIIFSIWIIFPFYWILVSTLKTQGDLFSRVPIFFTIKLTFVNYLKVFNDPEFMIPFRNSIIFGVVTSLIVVIVASIGAYSLAKIKYKGKKFIIFMLFVTQMLPAALMVVSIYYVFARLNITNKYFGIMLGYVTFGLPFSLLLLRNFFSKFPDELIDAALIDGCTELSAIRRVVIPLSMPGIIAAFLFTFILNGMIYYFQWYYLEMLLIELLQ